MDSDLPRLGTHITTLDGIRGLAIFMVVIFHTFMGESSPATGWFRWVFQASHLGETGVDLFFVLSGFLITGILYDTRGSDRYFLNFYGRRTVRIFPLYYGVLIVITVILPLCLGHRITDANPLALWTYTSNFPPTFRHEPTTFGHFWTLAVEEQFYLAWPAVVYMCSRTTLIRVCAGCIVGSIFVRIGLIKLGLSPNYLTLARLDSLAVGGLVAMMARGPMGLAGWRLRSILVMGLMVALAAPIYLAKSGSHESWLRIIKYTLLAGLYGSMLALVVASNSTALIARFFNQRWLRFLGKYSYGIYVFHLPIIQAIFAARASDRSGVFETPVAVASRVLAIFALSIGAAWLSWHLYEKHFLKLKKYFNDKAR